MISTNFHELARMGWLANWSRGLRPDWLGNFNYELREFHELGLAWLKI